jgi:hypothetical protein
VAGQCISTGAGQAARQQAAATLDLGKGRGIQIGIDVTSSGLLAVSALVVGVLVSSALIVEVATRGARRIETARGVKRH